MSASTRTECTTVPFTLTRTPCAKLVPITVIVRSELPAPTTAGAIWVIVGVVLLTMKVSGRDVPPPGDGFVTDTLTTWPVARRSAGTVTLS